MSALHLVRLFAQKYHHGGRGQQRRLVPDEAHEFGKQFLGLLTKRATASRNRHHRNSRQTAELKDGVWAIRTVDWDTQTGKFESMTLDSHGNPC